MGFFLAGAIAISALMLPGISGSFMLVLMGMYSQIIGSLKLFLKEQDLASLTTIGLFALGCLLGLGLFSRVLSWLFRHFHDATMAALTGFMLGSLNKIWPWKVVLEYRMNSKGIPEPLIEQNVWPWDFQGTPYVGGVLVLIALGMLVVFLLEKYGTKK